MKKWVLIFGVISLMFSCERDKELSEHDLIINAFYKYSESPDFKSKTANNSVIMIFNDEGKDIDNEKTLLLHDSSLTFTDGTKSKKFEYISNDLTGINTFTGIPNGSYVLAAVYKPYEYIVYYTMKRITITKDNHPLLFHNVTFDLSKDLGYQAWKED